MFGTPVQEGVDWDLENELHEDGETNNEIPITYCDDDIIQHVLSYVLSAAGNWNNKKIEEYFKFFDL